MKFGHLKIIVLLFGICLLVSAVLMFVSNLEIVVVCCVLAFLISFWIQCREVEKNISIHPEYCFEIVFSVIASFVLAMAIVCVISGFFLVFLIAFSDKQPRYIFINSLEFAQVLCAPFVVVLMESAIIILMNKSKICVSKK